MFNSNKKESNSGKGKDTILRVMDKSKGDAELCYNTCDANSINKIVKETIMPKLKQGWFLVGKSEEDDSKMIMAGNEIANSNGTVLIQKTEQVKEFLKDEKTTNKLLSLPLVSG